MNTIVDMQSEKDFFYHWKKFEYNHDFVKVFWNFHKIVIILLVYWFLVYDVLGNNVCSYRIDYNISSSFKNLHVAKNLILNFNRVLNSLRLLKLLLRSFTTNNWSI